MFFKGFELSIQGKQEDTAGYVRMKHEEEYAVVMRNNTNRRIDADLIIDGKSVGEFRIKPFDSVRIDRPADVARKFTFLKRGSEEAKQAQLDRVPITDLGLVQVVFKPEKQNYSLVTPVSYTAKEAPILRAARASSGGTGLGRKSNQEFIEVGSLETDRAEWVQISLRLTFGEKYGAISDKNRTRVPKFLDF